MIIELISPGLLEKPLIVESKRERKVVNRHSDVSDSVVRRESLDYTQGKGVKLSEIPLILQRINKADTEDLHVLHRIMYRTKGIVQGDPKLAPPLGRRSGMTWSLSDQTGLKYN